MNNIPIYIRLFNLLNPENLVTLYKNFKFRLLSNAKKGLKVTHRAQIYNHGFQKNNVSIGFHVILDSTFDIYSKGSLSIGDYTFVGRSRVYAANKVSIGSFCLISDNVCIMDSDLHPVSISSRRQIALAWSKGQFPDVYTNIPSSPVSIGDDCWIGFGSSILKGVTIGNGAIVGAGSVVTKDVPPWTIVAGNPARIIREIPENER